VVPIKVQTEKGGRGAVLFRWEEQKQHDLVAAFTVAQHKAQLPHAGTALQNRDRIGGLFHTGVHTGRRFVSIQMIPEEREEFPASAGPFFRHRNWRTVFQAK